MSHFLKFIHSSKKIIAYLFGIDKSNIHIFYNFRTLYNNGDQGKLLINFSSSKFHFYIVTRNLLVKVYFQQNDLKQN